MTTHHVDTAQVTTTRAGGYAVTTIHSMPWLDTPIKQKKNKTKKQKTTQQIVNQIFYECSQITDDTFWKSIFLQAANGKLPRGFLFKGNLLTYKRGSKTQRLEVSDDPIEALSTCMSFFRSNAGIRSQTDQEREKQEIEEKLLKLGSIENCMWSDIKKKKVQEILINSFVDSITKSMNLSIKQRDQLTTLINLGFLLGYFTSSSVQFNDGIIKGITGLSFNSETKEFILDVNLSARPKTSRSKFKFVLDSELLDPSNKPHQAHIDIVSFIQCWENFLLSLNYDSKSPQLRVIGNLSEDDDSIETSTTTKSNSCSES